MESFGRAPHIGVTTAVVVIGRNEGDRLIRCLAAIEGQSTRIIYVDSGSNDGSVEAARAAGVVVEELELSSPFTAARARNVGLEVIRRGVATEYVQFVDGDCELQPTWIAKAVDFLEEHPTAAVAYGRLRERYPGASVYNRLCDYEWDTPVGRSKSCGGIALMRITAIDEVGGFNSKLVAGEEPELCVRLRGNGWEIWRLEAEMAVHDAAMTKFSQWWKRARRGGMGQPRGWRCTALGRNSTAYLPLVAPYYGPGCFLCDPGAWGGMESDRPLAGDGLPLTDCPSMVARSCGS